MKPYEKLEQERWEKLAQRCPARTTKVDGRYYCGLFTSIASFMIVECTAQTCTPWHFRSKDGS